MDHYHHDRYCVGYVAFGCINYCMLNWSQPTHAIVIPTILPSFDKYLSPYFSPSLRWHWPDCLITKCVAIDLCQNYLGGAMNVEEFGLSSQEQPMC
jgi:hypothetical protein